MLPTYSSAGSAGGAAGGGGAAATAAASGVKPSYEVFEWYGAALARDRAGLVSVLDAVWARSKCSHKGSTATDAIEPGSAARLAAKGAGLSPEYCLAALGDFSNNLVIAIRNGEKEWAAILVARIPTTTPTPGDGFFAGRSRRPDGTLTPAVLSVHVDVVVADSSGGSGRSIVYALERFVGVTLAHDLRLRPAFDHCLLRLQATPSAADSWQRMGFVPSGKQPAKGLWSHYVVVPLSVGSATRGW